MVARRIVLSCLIAFVVAAACGDDSAGESAGDGAGSGSADNDDAMLVGNSHESCAEMTAADACAAHQYDGPEGFPENCVWVPTTLVSDIATCGGGELGRCTDYYGAIDGCEDPAPLTPCVGEPGNRGLVYFETEAGFEVVEWTGDDCSDPPGTPCDLMGDDDAAAACNCLCG